MDKKHCVVLSVQPSRAQIDEKVIVLVQNTPPGFQMTIHSLHHSDDGISWEAYGHYNADATGTVNVSQDTSVGGTYFGVEPMGLLWSLKPVPGSQPWVRFRKMKVDTPMEVTISVYQGHQTVFVDQVQLASVLVERHYMAPGVRRIPITESDLTATLFLPPGPGPFPGVLDLWGGAGQLVEYRSALLASHGFASLALDYLTPKITLKTGKLVKDDYFEVAYKILQQHPQVNGSRIAMIGLSFSTSITLKMAIYSEVMKLSCVVCTNGSHAYPANASVEEIFTVLKKNSEKMYFNEECQAVIRGLALPIPTDPAEKLDVGCLRCPLMLIVGEDDQNWPSRELAHDLKEMMQQAGNSHLLTCLSYPNAGHLIEPPYTPHTRASKFRSVLSREMIVILWGGETVAHSVAQEDAWRKQLAFLQENLYGRKNSAVTSISHL